MRDPRVDPRVGDVFRWRSMRREVTALFRDKHGQDCVGCLDGGYIHPARSTRPTLEQFRKWARRAYVEHTSPEPARSF
jgi:hypothetical protein